MSNSEVTDAKKANDACLTGVPGGASKRAATSPAPVPSELSDDSHFHRLFAELERAREELRVLKSAGAGAWP